MILRHGALFVVLALALSSAICAIAALHEVGGGMAHGIGNDRSAQEVVRDSLKRCGMRVGFDKARGYVVDVAASDFNVPDPTRDALFFVKRDAATSLNMVKHACRIVSALGLVNVNSAKKQQASSEPMSMVSEASGMLMGLQMLMQAESLQDSICQIASAGVWSKNAHDAALAIMLKQASRERPAKLSVEEWVDSQDIALMSGIRHFVDNKGIRRVVGISARELAGDPTRDACLKCCAQLCARAYAIASLMSSCTQHTMIESALAEEDADVEVTERILDSMSMNIRDRTVVGLHELATVEAVHPMTGKKVVVCLQAIDAETASRSSGVYSKAIEEYLKNGVRGVMAMRQDNNAGDVYSGAASFGWREGGRDFLEKYESAFYEAYIQALSSMSQTRGLKSSVRCSSELDSGKNAQTKAIRKQAKDLPESYESQCREMFGGWVLCRNMQRGRMAGESPSAGTWEGQFEWKDTVLGNFSISQQNAYDETTGIFKIKVDLKTSWGCGVRLPLAEFIQQVDFSKRIGPRRYRDDQGRLWLIGIGLSDATLEDAKELSEKKALDALCLATILDLESHSMFRLKYGLSEEGVIDVAENMSLKQELFRNKKVERALAGARKRKFVGHENLPVSGERVLMTVLAVDSSELGPSGGAEK